MSLLTQVGGRPLAQRFQIEVGRDGDRRRSGRCRSPCAAGSRGRGRRRSSDSHTSRASMPCATAGARPAARPAPPRARGRGRGRAADHDGLAGAGAGQIAAHGGDARHPGARAPLTARPPRRRPRRCRKLTVPASPRKSCPSRTTSCTGKRKAPSALATPAAACCRCSSSAGPSYQGMFGRALRDVVAEHRGHRDGRRIRRSRSGRRAPGNPPRWRGSAGSDQSTRSILLTASTTCVTPIRSRMAACRRVCYFTPLRASTSRMATSACEAPVAMLRVYCSWPGLSMMTSRRAGVSK